jgi:hypothetical protein
MDGWSEIEGTQKRIMKEKVRKTKIIQILVNNATVPTLDRDEYTNLRWPSQSADHVVQTN